MSSETTTTRGPLDRYTRAVRAMEALGLDAYRVKVPRLAQRDAFRVYQTINGRKRFTRTRYATFVEALEDAASANERAAEMFAALR